MHTHMGPPQRAPAEPDSSLVKTKRGKRLPVNSLQIAQFFFLVSFFVLFLPIAMEYKVDRVQRIVYVCVYGGVLLITSKPLRKKISN